MDAKAVNMNEAKGAIWEKQSRATYSIENYEEFQSLCEAYTTFERSSAFNDGFGMSGLRFGAQAWAKMKNNGHSFAPPPWIIEQLAQISRLVEEFGPYPPNNRDLDVATIRTLRNVKNAAKNAIELSQTLNIKAGTTLQKRYQKLCTYWFN